MCRAKTVFKELAGTPNTPPFMFVTGFGEIDQAVRLMRSGAVDFMTKPFEMDDFLHRIELQPSAAPPDSAERAYALGESHEIQRTSRI